MSENHEHSARTSDAAPFQEDDFPADYFDDSNEAATFEGSPAASVADPEVKDEFAPEYEYESQGAKATLTMSPPAKAKPIVVYERPGPPDEVPPADGLVPLTLTVAAFIVIVTLLLYGSKPTPSTEESNTPLAAAVVSESPKPNDPPATPVATTTTTASTSAAGTAENMENPIAAVGAAAPAPAPSPSPTELLAADLKATHERLTALSDRIDALPKPVPPVDLTPLEVAVADQSKSIESLVPVSEKLAKIEETVGGLTQSVDSIKRDVESLKDAVKKASEAVATLAATMTKPAAAPESTAKSEYENAAGLFKAGKYNEAQPVFAKLAAANPSDARVFYFAALANGLAKRVWTGETEFLVNKGIDLEKGGNPKKEEIDAAFADLIPQLKAWLDAYRARVSL